MSDKHAKNERELENPFLNEEAAAQSDESGHAENDFNALISDQEASYTQDSELQTSDHILPEMPQLQMPDFQAPEQTASESGSSDEHAAYEEATDAFNDLADAFTTDTTAPGSDDDNSDSSSHPDQSDSDADSANEQGSKTSPPDDQFPVFDSDEQTPASSQPISGDSIPTQDSNSLFENEGPAFADLSGHDDTNNAPKKHIIALVAAILITTSAGIYWYTTGSTEQLAEHVKTESLKSPATVTQNSSVQTNKSTPKASNSEPSKAIAIDQQKTPNSSTESKSESAIPTSLSTADAIKLMTANRAETSEKSTQPKNAPAMVSRLDGWVIIAPVTSKISARLYVESFKEKGTASEILESNKGGSKQYAVRISGFNSKQDAYKQIKKLSSLGLQNAKALKATSTWTGDTPSPAAINTPKPTPITASIAKTVPVRTNTGKPAPSTSAIHKAVKTKATPKATPQEAKTSEVQQEQQVIEFDLDDLLYRSQD